MEIKELIAKLESSAEFKSWEEQNKDFYIVHIFYMTNHPPQIGYYNEEVDKIITFDVGDKIVVNPTTEVFKEDKKKVNLLDVEKIKFDMPEIKEKVKAFKEENYPNEIIDKEMSILQEISGDFVYNITYFTKAFNTLNVKVNGISGEIMSHDLSSLVSF
jgi:hypothetical protein